MDQSLFQVSNLATSSNTLSEGKSAFSQGSGFADFKTTTFPTKSKGAAVNYASAKLSMNAARESEFTPHEPDTILQSNLFTKETQMANANRYLSMNPPGQSQSYKQALQNQRAMFKRGGIDPYTTADRIRNSKVRLNATSVTEDEYEVYNLGSDQAKEVKEDWLPAQDDEGPARERTYIMIKPDGVQRGLVSQIMARFEQRGLKMVALKMF